MLHSLSGGAWDPHDINMVATTSESLIQFWDLRTMKYVFLSFLYNMFFCGDQLLFYLLLYVL